MKKKPRAKKVPHVKPVKTTSRPVHAETSFRELQGGKFRV
jgi:hypothetical protein